MRTQTKSIVTALVLLSLVSGAIGCRSNGIGPWYHPKTYSWYNPFKEGEAPPYRAEETAQAHTKPSLDAKPNVYTPPGGYANKTEEQSFLSGGTQKAVQTQYGIGESDVNRVASTVYPATEGASVGYSAPEPYNPYSSADPNPMNTTPSQYQQTRYQQAYEQQAAGIGTAVPMGSQPVMPGNPVGTLPAAESMPIYGNPVGTPAPAAVAPYAPTTNPVAPATGVYTTPVQQPQPAVSPYANAPTVYGTPAATPYNVDPAYGAGYTANPSNYQPTTTGGFQ